MTARPGRIVAPILALALAGGVLTGCSGGSSEAESSSPSSTSTTATSSTTSTAATTTTTTQSSTSNATYAGAPGVPEEAKYKTDAGAIAFAKFYNEEINRLGQSPKTGVLDILGTSGCKTCRGHIRTIENNVKSKSHFDGVQFKTRRAYTNPDATVGLVVDMPAVAIVRSDGSVSSSFPAEGTAARVFHLTWTAGGWRVTEIQADNSVTS